MTGMVSFTAHIRQFEEQGEKTGWTYIEISRDITDALLPGNRKSFRVKGKLDQYPIRFIALLPMKGGGFIMLLNAVMRKGIAKSKGASLKVQLSLDEAWKPIDPDLLLCLEDSREADHFFKSLPPGHQRYFSNWVSSAKTDVTKVKRIAASMTALQRRMNFGAMLRELREQKGR